MATCNSANEKLVQYLKDLQDDPAMSSNILLTLSKAIRSIQEASTPIRTESEAIALKFVGPWVVRTLRKKGLIRVDSDVLAPQQSSSGPSRSTSQSPSRAAAAGAPTHSPKSTFASAISTPDVNCSKKRNSPRPTDSAQVQKKSKTSRGDKKQRSFLLLTFFFSKVVLVSLLIDTRAL
eukprot:Rmarinus@m.21865